jgi:hypothetical protein
MGRHGFVAVLAALVGMGMSLSARAGDVPLHENDATNVAWISSTDSEPPPPAPDLCLPCDCCEPLWSVSAGAIFLHRSSCASLPVVSTFNGTSFAAAAAVTINTTPVIDAKDLTFPYAAGPEVDIVRHCVAGLDVEVRYFGVDSGRANAFAAAPPGTTFFFNQLGAPLGDITSSAVNYGSRLDSVEVNLIKPNCDAIISPLLGIRWLQVHDSLLIHDTFNTGVGGVDDYSALANNSLVGCQIGAACRLWDREKLCVDCLLKSGLYNNYLRTDVSGNEGSAVGGPGAFSQASLGTNTAAFVGEIDLMATYQITCHLALQAGYQLMWIDGIALAPDQIRNTTLFTFDNAGQPAAVANPSTGLSRNTMFLNGANAGLVLTF